MTTFQGIPAGAFGFYEELQDNNNRQWWQEHKAGYQSLVKEPLASLLAELEPRFGPTLQTVPRGDSRAHPRAELLKHTALAAGVHRGRPEWLGTAGAAHEIAELWEDLRPLVDWVSRHAAP